MSDYLLQKSLKLLQENKRIKKTKKSDLKKLKKRKNCFNTKQLAEQALQENILRNLRSLEELSREASVEISEEVLPKCSKYSKIDSDSKEIEHSTVFTDKDFEDFEKEYFDS